MEILDIIIKVLNGFGATLSIFILTLLFSLPLGLIIAFGRMSKNVLINNFCNVIISILRGTPLMLQLIVWCFGPYYLLGFKVSKEWRFVSIILGFSINYAAYFAEIYRAGILSIPNGQWEAAKVLGFNEKQTFFMFILPQMIKRVIPPVTNEVITLIKDTSLAFVVTYSEMFTIAKQVAANKTTIIPLFVAGIFYYIFNLFVASFMEMLEKKLNYYDNI